MWFPHAISKEVLSENFFGKKVYDLVILGSYFDHRKERKWLEKLLSKDVLGKIEKMIEETLENPAVSI